MRARLFTGLLCVCAAISTARAETYQVQNAYGSAVLEVKGRQFNINTMNFSGNLCVADGTMSGRGKIRHYRDEAGCHIRFDFSQSGRIRVDIPPAATAACSQYCGFNAYMEGDYVRLPAACNQQARQQSTERFLQAYRARHYQAAVRIQQQVLQQCEPFMLFTDAMRVRNDLAVAHKNAGNRAACRQALQPWAEHINGDTDFAPSRLFQDQYEAELKAARFNWNSCR